MSAPASSLQPVRGTHDQLPEDRRRHTFVVDRARDVVARYGFAEVATPIFEFTEVFARTLGDTSDIVTKEMYTFEDKGGDRITLRPEGTASIVRAFISNGLAHQVPLKYFYNGPMFRYERPQKGRLRQFHQVGIELLGVESPLADVEVIACAKDFLGQLGLADEVTLEINTLGDAESRAAYRDALVAYLSGHKDKLSEESLVRLEQNPLRILDSKDEGDRAVVAGVPPMGEFFNATSNEFFKRVLDGLDRMGVAYRHNHHLVRGLDYYGHTAFEFTTQSLGAQGTVLAGGRYDGLVKQMGGPQTAGIGWAAGIERLAMMVADVPPAIQPIALIPLGEAMEAEALGLLADLRADGFCVEMGYSGNMKKRMKHANKVNACAAVILGEDEHARGAATVRDMETGEQAEVPMADLKTHLARFR